MKFTYTGFSGADMFIYLKNKKKIELQTVTYEDLEDHISIDFLPVKPINVMDIDHLKVTMRNESGLSVTLQFSDFEEEDRTLIYGDESTAREPVRAHVRELFKSKELIEIISI